MAWRARIVATAEKGRCGRALETVDYRFSATIAGRDAERGASDLRLKFNLGILAVLAVGFATAALAPVLARGLSQEARSAS
jgi:hypothetical protein